MNTLATLPWWDRGPLICDVLAAGTDEAIERLVAELSELPTDVRVLALMDAVGEASRRENAKLEARVHALWAQCEEPPAP